MSTNNTVTLWESPNREWRLCRVTWSGSWTYLRVEDGVRGYWPVVTTTAVVYDNVGHFAIPAYVKAAVERVLIGGQS